MKAHKEHERGADLVRALETAASDALRAWQSMPDAGLTSDDPRWEWWYATYEQRRALQDALAALRAST